MKLEIRWNENAYTIVDVDVEEPKGRLIVQENMWNHGWDRVRDEYGGDADAYVLARHEDVIKEYVDTGMTYFQWQAMGDGQTLIVPMRKISREDMQKYFTINVHLGKGKEGFFQPGLQSRDHGVKRPLHRHAGTEHIGKIIICNGKTARHFLSHFRVNNKKAPCFWQGAFGLMCSAGSNFRLRPGRGDAAGGCPIA